jgi:hypothetical protein
MENEQEIQKVEEPTHLTPRKVLDILISTRQYKRAYEMAERNNINLEIKDSRGTIYQITKGGCLRRAIPKKIRKRAR